MLFILFIIPIIVFAYAFECPEVSFTYSKHSLAVYVVIKEKPMMYYQAHYAFMQYKNE